MLGARGHDCEIGDGSWLCDEPQLSQRSAALGLFGLCLRLWVAVLGWALLLRLLLWRRDRRLVDDFDKVRVTPCKQYGRASYEQGVVGPSVAHGTSVPLV